MNKLWRRIGNRKNATQNKPQEPEPARKEKNATQNKPQEPEPASKGLVLLGNSAKRFDLEDILRASAEVLGKGTVGTTYLAWLEVGTAVVVKRHKEVVVSAEDFRDKVLAVGEMEHENLLPLRGYYYSKDEKFLLYDYMPMGSLSRQLHEYRESGGKPLSWEVRLSIVLGAARAIEHLHAQRPPNSHGNIKSSNVLLTPSYEARVSDYGLAPLKRSAREDGAYLMMMADVYGFGVLLLELLTGKPHTQRGMKEGVDLPAWVQSVAREHWNFEVFDLELLRYHHVEEGLIALLEVAISCVSPNLPKRPQMSEVRRKIEELCSPGRQRDGDSQPDRVNEGTKDTSSSLIPNAQGDRDSQLHQFSELSNHTDARRPLDGVMEVFERVYVFDCCLTVDGLKDEDYQILIGGVAGKVRQQCPEALFRVFHFGEQESQSQMCEVLSHMPVMNYPIHHGDCPILTMEMIHQFLRSADAWLSPEGQKHMLLMHCERGGWPVLAFMLAALQSYWKNSNDEEETLHLIYKSAPPDLLHLNSPLNPLPSQLRYLRYISTSNVDLEKYLPDKALMLDSVLLRFMPCVDAEMGCHLMFKIFGQDPRNLTVKSPRVLFSTPEKGKNIRHYKQADCKLVKAYIHCPVQGDVVLECTSLNASLEHRETMFRVMFNTAYLLKNVLMLGLDQMDVPWDHQNQHSGDFRAEITFSEISPAASLVSVDSSSDEEQKENQLAKGARKIEAQELQVEDRAVYHALPSRDANTSHEENEVQEWPIQSDTAFPTSILQTMLPSQLEASVHSAFDKSLAISVSFRAMLTKNNIEPLQSPKQHLVSSLDLSQDVHPGENTESARWERIAAATETNMEVNSVSESASLSAVDDGSVEASAAGVSNSAQLPDMMLPKLEKLYQQEGSPSLTSMSSGYDYDVFLSFRGPDTRSGITSVLYTRLVGARIRTFKDDEELRVGEEFGPELLKAIDQSKIAIPIFSKGYASSKWCLNELVQIVECSKTRRQKIMPIFYDVTPTEVRYQIGSYEEAFLPYKEKFNANVNKWKAALNHAANLSGWDNSKKNRGEGELVDEIIQKVIDELKMAYLLVTDCLVGVENHVKEIDTMMRGDSEDIRILGIHGMGGVGKTTLAKIIYNRLSHHFEVCCFLSNIKETSEHKGIECLQNQLISEVLKKQWSNINNGEEGIKTIKERLGGKKVLVLLDDVDQMTHWDALIGKPAWFGLGSRIIITSRNRDIVNVPEICYPYELMSMNFNQSLQLFCKHAFGRDYPVDDYIVFSTEVVQSTGGLPLALEAIGKLLPNRSKDVWDVILKKLKQFPLIDVKRKLKISYDALDDWQKHIFLEIACLFTGFDQRIVLPSWKESNLFPEEGLEVLQRMSLIKIGKDNKLWMHDQLRGLGRDIVRRECDKERKKKTRLWNHAEGLDAVMEMKGRKNVEALYRKVPSQLLSNFANEEVERLSSLRYAEVRVFQDNWPSNDREYGNTTCMLLNRIGICVCQLGKQYFLPSYQ